MNPLAARSCYENAPYIITEFENQYFMMTSSNGNIFRVTGPLCGEFTGPGEFPTQRPVTRSFDVFFDLRLNKKLSKQSWGWWFETLSDPLLRQRDVMFMATLCVEWNDDTNRIVNDHFCCLHLSNLIISKWYTVSQITQLMSCHYIIYINAIFNGVWSWRFEIVEIHQVTSHVWMVHFTFFLHFRFSYYLFCFGALHHFWNIVITVFMVIPHIIWRIGVWVLFM